METVKKSSVIINLDLLFGGCAFPLELYLTCMSDFNLLAHHMELNAQIVYNMQNNMAFRILKDVNDAAPELITKEKKKILRA